MPRGAGRRSPLQLSLDRFVRKRAARIGMALLSIMVLLGIYAPFLACEFPFLWVDHHGVSFPLFRELFNSRVFEHRHDLLFNLFAIAIPLLLPLWWWAGNRWGRFASTFACLGFVGAVWILCQLPLFSPLLPGGDRRAIWDDRTQHPGTRLNLVRIRDLLDRSGDRLDPAILEKDDILVDADGEYIQLAQIERDEEGRPVLAFANRLGSQRGRPVDVEEMSLPPDPTAIYPLFVHAPRRNYEGGSYRGPGATNPQTGAAYWLGSDPTGRDVLVRMLYGTRISLTIGLFATTLSMLIGIIIGAVSGYFGGWVDILLQRLVEVMMTFPSFILILVVVAILGRDIIIIMTVIGLTGWAGVARLVRGEFLVQTGREYVLACEAMGLPRWRIMFLHIFPNTLTPLLIGGTFSIAGAVLTESGLAFIGLGDETVPSWGGMLAMGREIPKYYWLIYAPGLAIFVLVTALNLIGNSLREALDVKAQ